MAIFFIGMLAAASPAATLDKAERLMAEEKWPAARKQFEAVSRKSGGQVRDRAYLGMARTYFMEKDFHGLTRSLAPVVDRLPANADGVWMRILLYRAARMTSDVEAAGRHVQSLLRLRPDLPVRDIAEHIRLVREIGIAGKAPELTASSSVESTRRNLFAQAETLMTSDISSGAIRVWTALVSGPLDRIGQNSLFRLAQAFDGEGDMEDASVHLKLYAILFPEDPRAADALYRVAKWLMIAGRDDFRTAASLIREVYPNTLYGAAILVDTARAWPEKESVRLMFRALRSSPGLPETFLEPGLATAMTRADWLTSDEDRAWAAQRYLISFPAGPSAGVARSFKP